LKIVNNRIKRPDRINGRKYFIFRDLMKLRNYIAELALIQDKTFNGLIPCEAYHRNIQIMTRGH